MRYKVSARSEVGEATYLVKRGRRDLSAMLLHLVMTSHALGEHQTQVGSVAQLAPLILRQSAQHRDGVLLSLGGVEDLSKRLNGLGKLEEQVDLCVAGDFAIASSHAAGLEVGVSPELARLRLQLEEVAHHGEAARPAADDN